MCTEGTAEDLASAGIPSEQGRAVRKLMTAVARKQTRVTVSCISLASSVAAHDEQTAWRLAIHELRTFLVFDV